MAELVYLGFVGASISLYGCYKSINSMNVIGQKKIDILSNGKLFSDLTSFDNDKYMLVSHHNTSRSGFVKIFGKNDFTMPYIMITPSKWDSPSLNVTSLYVPDWKSLETIGYNLNMGLTKIIPPTRECDILLHDCFAETMITARSLCEMETYLIRHIGLNACLSASYNYDNYMAKNYSFGDRTLYMYGKRTGDEIFKVDIMGTCPKEIVDKVFEKEECVNSFFLIGSVVGLCMSVMSIIVE